MEEKKVKSKVSASISAIVAKMVQSVEFCDPQRHFISFTGLKVDR